MSVIGHWDVFPNRANTMADPPSAMPRYLSVDCGVCRFMAYAAPMTSFDCSWCNKEVMNDVCPEEPPPKEWILFPFTSDTFTSDTVDPPPPPILIDEVSFALPRRSQDVRKHAT